MSSLQHSHDLRYKRYERMHARTGRISTSVPSFNSAVSVVRSAEILLTNKTLTNLRTQSKPCITNGTTTAIVVEDMCGIESENNTVVLETNFSNALVRNDALNESLSNWKSKSQADENKIIGFKPKYAYRERNNNVQNSQILARETRNSFDKNIKDFGKKRLSFKSENFLRHIDTEESYSERNGINIVQSNIIEEDSDFRNATQFMTTDLVEHSINSSSMDQFLLSSGGDSDCSNLAKHLAVAVRSCDDSRQEGNANNFRISAAEIHYAKEVERSGNENVNGNAIVNKVLTEFVLENDDSGEILISSCNSEIAEHNEKDTVGCCIFNVNEKIQNLVEKTVISYDQQFQLAHNSDMDTDYSQPLSKNSVKCNQGSDYSPIAERNMHDVDDETIISAHGVLESADQQTIAEITSSKGICVEYKLMPKYMLYMESKQSLSPNQQQQHQKLASSQLIIKTNAENAGHALDNVVNNGVDVKHVQKLESISGFDDSMIQERAQRGQLYSLRNRKLSDNENSMGTARIRR
ncbi:uncharacterized protein LOC126766134 [Bactrocera neohumeralis]|uniref:uncharacterized protein LOC126766134 n=1 Tax=Bactrocera neohumeralis TaxID=98809 RepID=UPI002166B7A4|nr:uncharacterized protein LOC126766134 [Bactrocera neohumeralis]